MRRLSLALIVLVLAGCSSSHKSSDPSVPPSSPATRSSPASPTGGSAPPSLVADWPTYHGDFARSGRATTFPAPKTLRIAANVKLDGQVYASPIVARGITVVATEQDTVYGLDNDGRQLWRTKLGDPSPAPERPCGNIDPLGVTGTPVYANGLVYAVAEHGGAIRHELVALDVTTGTVRWRRGVDLPGADSGVMQQRGALAITGGKVWVPFGGLFGDCGNYKGRVVGVALDGSGDPVLYGPPTGRGGGMWNPAGGTVDARGRLLVVSANGAAFPGDGYDHTNSVLALDAGRLADSFAPSDWAENNQGDVGLGSQGVALVGDKWAVLGGKSGPVYVLRQDRLGGIGGQVSVQDICRSFGGAAVDGDVVYLPCTDGVRAVRVDDAGALHVLWHAADSIAGSPVIGGGRVWALDQEAGVLHALDPASGRSAAQIAVGVTSRFATPALHGNHVLVPTLAGLTIVAV